MRYPFSIPYFYSGKEVSHPTEARYKYISIITIPLEAAKAGRQMAVIPNHQSCPYCQHHL